jgi:beta-glucanase (GH16 family)
MKAVSLFFGIALSTIALAANMSAEGDQQGAQVRTKQTFGYGKLVATLKLSTEAGIINGFFMLKFQNGWPYGWTEIDYEYVPGNNDAGRRTTQGDCGPGGNNCTQSVLDSQSAADFISVNIIGGPSDAGAKPDSQVFYKLSKAYLETVKTYTIEFTPDEVQWGAAGVNDDKPFMYQKPGTDNKDIHQSLGLQYLVGKEMYIWFNIYSGLGSDGSFGGTKVIPKQNTEMVVENVAFYPMIDGQFSTKPSMSSDFKNGKYTLGDNTRSSFGAIWLNEDFQSNPIYTRAAHARVVPGTGLVMKYTFTP